MLASTLVVVNGQVIDAEEVLRDGLVIQASFPAATRPLLVTVVSVEDQAFHLAFTAVLPYAMSLEATGLPQRVDLVHPLTELLPGEQSALRGALTRQSWAAWARAPQHVRALLGCPEPPLLLAEAARQFSIPLPTLANAAVNDRLPTIRAGDRHLVYTATIIEAQAQGVLHMQRGRPRRSRR